MANNNFKPFAAAAGANVMAQADYEALAALLTGFQSGTAQSAQLNKVWRQSSIMAAVLGQFIVDLTGQDAVDDGTTDTLLANLKMAVQAQSAAVVGQVRNLRMSVTTASNTATLNADEIVVGTALGGQKYLLKQFSKTINLAAAGAGGMDTGSAPVSGFVGIYAIYNPTTGASALLATNATAAKVPEVYAGGHMPSGYTASALVSVVPTNGAAQFPMLYQADRQVDLAQVGILGATTDGGAKWNSVGISGVAPMNAKTFKGYASGANANAGAFNLGVGGDSSGIGNLTANFSANGCSLQATGIPIVTPQTVYWYYHFSGTVSSLSFTLYGSGYTF
ncbi:hypothetical protein [Burkholderia cenocepacia]|nr:hypothetical protein [Burkholderia cenocepacia]MBR8025243.1 hypothetical protein [Burkholderia cenocepacia]